MRNPSAFKTTAWILPGRIGFTLLTLGGKFARFSLWTQDLHEFLMPAVLHLGKSVAAAFGRPRPRKRICGITELALCSGKVRIQQARLIGSQKIAPAASHFFAPQWGDLSCF